MSRAEEITQAALDYANNLDDLKPTDVFSRNLCIALGQAFIEGAKWADSHQAEKGLEIAREEVIDWIDKHWREYVNVDADGVVCFGHWKNDLRKAIKDEQGRR